MMEIVCVFISFFIYILSSGWQVGQTLKYNRLSLISCQYPCRWSSANASKMETLKCSTPFMSFSSHTLTCSSCKAFSVRKLPNVLFSTLICSWRQRGLGDTQPTLLIGHRKDRLALLIIAPWGFLTQNKQKVCFLGLLKSCRHLVLYRGQIINHSALPHSVLSLPSCFTPFRILKSF